jgi:PleD family two-component response regulator
MFVLAVRLSGRPTEAELRSLCQIVRASVRNLDRVVRRDDSTLIVCMPSADAMVATGLGHQICEAVASLGLADRTDREGVHPVSVGILQALPGDDFDELAGRVCEAAVHGASASGEPIRVCDPGHKLVAESSSETFPNSP